VKSIDRRRLDFALESLLATSVAERRRAGRAVSARNEAEGMRAMRSICLAAENIAKLAQGEVAK